MLLFHCGKEPTGITPALEAEPEYLVHLAGSIERTGAYWRNEMPYVISEFQIAIQSMFVSGSDIHLVGRSDYQACYWKNGEQVFLTNSIFAIDDEIFIGGYYFDREKNTYVACYWHNGERIKLPGQRALTNSIFVVPH